jgi:signal transduction histidine kinase
MLGPEEGEPSPAAAAMPITPALADRFQSLLALGREIATASSRAALLGRVEEAGSAMLRGEACRVSDLDGGPPPDPGIEPLLRAAVEAGEPVASPWEGRGTRRGSALVAPIVVSGRARAVLVATHRGVVGLFGEEERRLAAYIAALAGAAWENVDRLAEVQALERDGARAEGEVRRLGERVVRDQEAERGRIAFALHDSAGQALAAICSRIDALRGAVGQEASAGLDEIRVAVEGLLDDLRHISHDLHPPVLDRLGLVAALQQLVRGASTEACPVALTIEREPVGASPDTALAVFRIAQEALANVARHARAHRVTVRLEAPDGGGLALAVEDDGVGFDPRSGGGAAGLGLIGMRERARWLEGRLEVDSAPGRGTRVRVEIPGGGGV